MPHPVLEMAAETKLRPCDCSGDVIRGLAAQANGVRGLDLHDHVITDNVPFAALANPNQPLGDVTIR